MLAKIFSPLSMNWCNVIFIVNIKFQPDNTKLITCPLPPTLDKSAATGASAKRGR